MVFKNLCILVLWTTVASALEGLTNSRLHGGRKSQTSFGAAYSNRSTLKDHDGG